MRETKRGTIEDPATDRLLLLAFEQQKAERLLAEADTHSKHVGLLDRQFVNGGPTLRELLADSGRGQLIELFTDTELDHCDRY